MNAQALRSRDHPRSCGGELSSVGWCGGKPTVPSFAESPPAGALFLTSADLCRLQRTCAQHKSQLCLISVQNRMVVHQIKLDVRGC